LGFLWDLEIGIWNFPNWIEADEALSKKDFLMRARLRAAFARVPRAWPLQCGSDIGVTVHRIGGNDGVAF
jgi:hypothetical protein